MLRSLPGGCRDWRRSRPFIQRQRTSPTPAHLQSQDVVVAAFAVATNSNCCLAHAMKLSAAMQSVKVKAAAASAFIVDNIISVLQESMWIKPFAEFAPRMRVMRYSSERRLQTPNIAAHYKKELCVLLKVTDTHNMINMSVKVWRDPRAECSASRRDFCSQAQASPIQQVIFEMRFCLSDT